MRDAVLTCALTRVSVPSTGKAKLSMTMNVSPTILPCIMPMTCITGRKTDGRTRRPVSDQNPCACTRTAGARRAPTSETSGSTLACQLGCSRLQGLSRAQRRQPARVRCCVIRETLRVPCCDSARTSRLPPDRACIAILRRARADMRTLRRHGHRQVLSSRAWVGPQGCQLLDLSLPAATASLARCLNEL